MAKERERILNEKIIENETDYVKLVNVTKIFKRFKLKKLKTKSHLAVNNLCLGIFLF